MASWLPEIITKGIPTSFRWSAREILDSPDQGIENDAIDRIVGFQEIAHQGTVCHRANAIVVVLKDFDEYVPDVNLSGTVAR
jgi:hypothetical protein